MNIVIDTNILISSLYKPSGIIYELLAKLSETHQLFISDVSLTEIIKHQQRIIKSAKTNIIAFENLKAKLLHKTELIPLSIIPLSAGEQAYLLVNDIDENDIAFVATTIFVDGFLWTGDKPLYDGLRAKGFENVLNSNEIKKLTDYE
jgi:predicted nucleic acid-binding protein